MFVMCFSILGAALAADFEIIPKATEDVGGVVNKIGS